jgi:CheY-like chemotaxis protein
MDLSMPVMDGWQALERLRQMPEVAETPVIALTAHAMKGDRARALEAGFDAYITKPFRVDTLMESITTSLQRISPTHSGSTQ